MLQEHINPLPPSDNDHRPIVYHHPSRDHITGSNRSARILPGRRIHLWFQYTNIVKCPIAILPSQSRIGSLARACCSGVQCPSATRCNKPGGSRRGLKSQTRTRCPASFNSGLCGGFRLFRLRAQPDPRRIKPYSLGGNPCQPAIWARLRL